MASSEPPLGGLLGRGEDAGRFDHDIDPQVFPGQRLGIALGQDLDLLAIHDERTVGQFDLTGKATVDGVVLEKMGKRGGVGDVVDRHDLIVPPLMGRPKDQSSDPTETVDADTDAHVAGSSPRPSGRKPSFMTV